MKTALLIACFILSAGFGESANSVVDGKKYLSKIVERMLELLVTETSISDGGLPMLDIIGNFSQMKSYGVTLDGLVKFHSGFVMRIEDFEFVETKYEDKTDDEQAYVRTIFTLLNVNMTYEVDPEFEEYKDRYSIVLFVGGLDFYIDVKKNHETSLVEASVTFYNIVGGAFKAHAFNFPSNPYTQLIGKEFKTGILANSQKESFKAWAKNLEKFASQACREIQFPEICYNCL